MSIETLGRLVEDGLNLNSTLGDKSQSPDRNPDNFIELQRVLGEHYPEYAPSVKADPPDPQLTVDPSQTMNLTQNG